MTLLEMWMEAKESDMNGAFELWVLIDFLVLDKKVLTYDSDASELDFYYQEKFRDAMNDHISEYMQRNNIVNLERRVD